jgi:hypothetical protein
MDAIGYGDKYVGLPCQKHCGGVIIYDGVFKCCYYGVSCDWILTTGHTGKPKGKRNTDTWVKIQLTPWYLNRLTSQ